VTREVRVRATAWADLANAVRSIARTGSLESAILWRRKIETKIQSLAKDAGTWPEADEAVKFGIDLRCRLFGRRRQKYRILYTIEGGLVIVHRIRHTSQDYLSRDEL